MYNIFFGLIIIKVYIINIIKFIGDRMIVKDWCMFCGECAGVCPRNLIEVKESTLIFDESECKDCSTCVKVCPITALEKE
ncbi:ferredoxin [Methanobrevibacter arboriphilus JCM 13429 = DSM 1125]|uniref:Ferredoxin n=2 Tax=Methanobrevibacter arboriphilus TaxID=39441 RepID=A0A1V6N0S7_METAZ|nr:ferredoxin [Methanobrevibacter arboriphilus JCM 13429 = DSM 1125]